MARPHDLNLLRAADNPLCQLTKRSIARSQVGDEHSLEQPFFMPVMGGQARHPASQLTAERAGDFAQRESFGKAVSKPLQLRAKRFVFIEEPIDPARPVGPDVQNFCHVAAVFFQTKRAV